ncbi:MAG: leucine-rich repeat protein [Christensenellaceae bacterium]|nr:leucine-rich repeat protein [Christensenellaceae bacterium]
MEKSAIGRENEMSPKKKLLIYIVVITIILAITTLIILFALDVFDLRDDNSSVAIISDISLDEASIENKYNLGEPFPSGVKINVIYSDGTQKTVDVNESMVTGFDTTTERKIEITITYELKSVKYEIDIINPVESIAINMDILKKTFHVGDPFPDDIKINATYLDGTVKSISVTSSMVTGFDTTKDGINRIYITYEGKNTDIIITIRKVILSMKLDESSIYNEYFVGDEFPEKVKLRVIYTDNSTGVINVSADMATGFNTESTGVRTIKITYDGKEIEHVVNIYKPIKSISLDTNSIDVDYSVGETFDFASTKLIIHHDDLTTTYIPLTASMLQNFNTDISGNMEFIVMYRNTQFYIDYKVEGIFTLNDFKIEFDFDTNLYRVLEYIGHAKDVIFPKSINNCKIGYIAPGILDDNILNMRNLIIPFIGSAPGDDVNNFDYLYDRNRVNNEFNGNFDYSLFGNLNVTIYSDYITEIGDDDFYGQILINVVTLPNGITRIGNNAFRESTLRSINLPSSLITIGDRAFKDATQLKYLEIPDSIKTIGTDAFNNIHIYIKLPESPLIENVASLTSGVYGLIVPSAIYNSYFESQAWQPYLSLLHEDDSIEIINDSYIILSKDNEKILLAYFGISPEAKVPNDVTIISSMAFLYNIKLQKVTLPEGLTKIGDRAFYFTIIESIILPSTLKELGDESLQSFLLSKLIIPESVTKIGENVTYGGMIIMESTQPTDNFKIDDVDIILVPANALTTYKNKWSIYSDKIYDVSISDADYFVSNSVLLYYFGDGENVVIPTGVVEIGEYAFSHRSAQLRDIKIISVTIPSSVKKISNNAFYSNLALASITFSGESNLEVIGDNAFMNTTSLVNFEWLDSLVTIGDQAFYNSSVSDVIFSDNSKLESLGSSAFRNCKNIVAVILPSNLQKLSAHIFYNCLKIEQIYIRSIESNNISYYHADWDEKTHGEKHTVVWGYSDES